jgi:hypothetical protein
MRSILWSRGFSIVIRIFLNAIYANELVFIDVGQGIQTIVF